MDAIHNCDEQKGGIVFNLCDAWWHELYGETAKKITKCPYCGIELLPPTAEELKQSAERFNKFVDTLFDVAGKHHANTK